MNPPRLTHRTLAFLIGAPLAWAALLMFHPAHDPADVYGTLRDQTTAWLVVHIGTLPLIAVMGVALFLLVRDLPGTAARIARAAIVPFVLFYGAAEAILGVATGVHVQQGNADAAQTLWDTAVLADLLPAIGAVAWITAAIAAAIAYRRANAPFAVSALLALSTILALHAPPIGPFALLCFAAAVVILARRQAAPEVEGPAATARAVSATDAQPPLAS
jgi:hypothetical protein